LTRLARRRAAGFTAQGALGKIDLLTTLGTLVGAVELIRENFFFSPARRTLATKGFEVLEAAESGAMLGCGLFFGHGKSSTPSFGDGLMAAAVAPNSRHRSPSPFYGSTRGKRRAPR
jgi:hypothetical protein